MHIAVSTTARNIAFLQPSAPCQHRRNMAISARCILTILMVLGVAHQVVGVIEDSDRSVLGLNFPYGRGLDTDLQLARLLRLPPLCHPKRNSELINSLLGLPKNMNNAGK